MVGTSKQKYPSRVLGADGTLYQGGLEASFAEEMHANGASFQYSPFRIPYVEPEKRRHYTPDFVTAGGVIIETKGRFVTADRHKMLLVKELYPALDIRFVFSNAKAKLSPKSKLTNADWCERYGFKWAHRHAPKSWFTEEVSDEAKEIMRRFPKRNAKDQSDRYSLCSDEA